MRTGARRLLNRPLYAPTRRAWLALCLWMACPVGALADIVSARYMGETTHYDHGILGDAVEYSGMMLRLSGGKSFLVGFSPNTRVFEDIAPRLWDVTGDGKPEVVVIETDPAQGAQLAIYGEVDGTIAKIAATPHIGRTHRWLAPIGAADLDGDGRIELAYIDRPHLAKTLRIWRYSGGKLMHVADVPGLTNHQIGWGEIPGGLRTCDGPETGPELITANADWTRIIGTRFDGTTAHHRDLGPYSTPQSLNAALRCD